MRQGMTGRRVLVTGAASGIGSGIVRRLLEDGARAIATDILCFPDAPDGAIRARHDVASEADWRRVERLARESLGGLDVLVNNAGIVSGLSIEDTSPEAWSRTLAVNLTGAMLGCQMAIRQMRESDDLGGNHQHLLHVGDHGTAGRRRL